MARSRLRDLLLRINYLYEGTMIIDMDKLYGVRYVEAPDAHGEMCLQLLIPAEMNGFYKQGRGLKWMLNLQRMPFVCKACHRVMPHIRSGRFDKLRRHGMVMKVDGDSEVYHHGIGWVFPFSCEKPQKRLGGLPLSALYNTKYDSHGKRISEIAEERGE